jgi:hypothetical protein
MQNCERWDAVNSVEQGGNVLTNVIVPRAGPKINGSLSKVCWILIRDTRQIQ